jgi:glycosyltransferase involved in cell wall biosynthesis
MECMAYLQWLVGRLDLKILQITQHYYPSVSFGGPVQVSHNLSKNMVRLGHDVTVFSTDAYDIGSGQNLKDRFLIIDGAKVHFFHNLISTYRFFISPGIISALSKSAGDFDIVHLHEYRTFQNLAFYFLNKTKTPYVLSPHGGIEYVQETLDVSSFRRIFDNVFGKKLLLNASAVFALTEFEKTQLVKMGVQEEKIEIVPNGVNPQDFNTLPPQGYFKSLFKLSKNDEIILFVGRLNALKGLDTLIKAFSLMRERKSLKLVIAGPDDGMFKSLVRLVTSLKLEDKVLFTGSLNRNLVHAALNDATAIVYATEQEGFPLVPIEAAMTGKPVIVSDLPSLDFVQKGSFGLLVKYGNVTQLKEAMERLLDNPVLARELGQNGRRYVKNNLSWSAISAKTEAIYSKILK